MDALVNKLIDKKNERLILISLRVGKASIIDSKESMEELRLLVKTRGGKIIESKYFHRDNFDPKFLIGSGQTEEIKKMVSENEINTVVFDVNDISPSQIRNLEKEFNCRVSNRTEVIMDIFSRRAKSSEAKIQVELARLKYILPRLKGQGIELSRLGGGIGTRGPGEAMHEKDRRHILKRIDVLKAELEKVEKHRQTIRKSRENVPCGAIIGYTNAGKSTLLSHLSKTELYSEDKLFATLDTFTRQIYLNPDRKLLLTDSVGFIKNMPANLVASFKSTLEEITESDFIIHCVDISSHNIESCLNTVVKEIESLGCSDKPVITFFNKSDLLTEDEVNRVLIKYDNSVSGSCMIDGGLDNLKNKIMQLLDKQTENNV